MQSNANWSVVLQVPLHIAQLKKKLNIYIYISIYIWEKKTNKLQVHPYKPVSWSPTHQGIQ